MVWGVAGAWDLGGGRSGRFGRAGKSGRGGGGGGEAESGRLLLIFCGDGGFVHVPRPGSFVQMKLHIKR